MESVSGLPYWGCPNRACTPCRNSGFSLLEILVTLVLLGLLANVALPEIDKLRTTLSKRQAENQFEVDLRRARAEALASGGRAVLWVASDNRSYSIGSDYLPFSGAGQADSTLYTTRLPSGITIVSSNRIIFDTRGFLVNETGSPVSRTLSLSLRGEVFSSVAITPIGMVTFTRSG